jgi:hypothetical protein
MGVVSPLTLPVTVQGLADTDNSDGTVAVGVTCTTSLAQGSSESRRWASSSASIVVRNRWSERVPAFDRNAASLGAVPAPPTL